MNYTLRKPKNLPESLVARLMTPRPPAYTFRLAPRDDAGAKVLGELTDQGLNLVANALSQSNDHILNFFTMLRTELAFYVGCLNLSEQLAKKREPIAFPTPAALGERKLTFRGLYDVCLTFKIDRRVVGNDLSADGRDFVIVTGANQGGKTTFLRSLGLAQLMMQCGMFVPAESFSANLCSHVFTHYRREEDATMKSGKLDEELKRCSAIVDQIAPDAILLFNESFASTNEREGSEIARQITSALLKGAPKSSSSPISMISPAAFTTRIARRRFACGPSEKLMADGPSNCRKESLCKLLTARICTTRFLAHGRTVDQDRARLATRSARGGRRSV